LPIHKAHSLAESAPRKDKERAMRQRKMKRYWKRLGELKTQLMDRPMSRNDLLEKIGAAKDRAGRQAATLVRVALAAAKPQAVKKSDPAASGNQTGQGGKKKSAPKQNLERSLRSGNERIPHRQWAASYKELSPLRIADPTRAAGMIHDG
jgi:hypothetical protein